MQSKRVFSLFHPHQHLLITSTFKKKKKHTCTQSPLYSNASHSVSKVTRSSHLDGVEDSGRALTLRLGRSALVPLCLPPDRQCHLITGATAYKYQQKIAGISVRSVRGFLLSAGSEGCCANLYI